MRTGSMKYIYMSSGEQVSKEARVFEYGQVLRRLPVGMFHDCPITAICAGMQMFIANEMGAKPADFTALAVRMLEVKGNFATCIVVNYVGEGDEILYGGDLPNCRIEKTTEDYVVRLQKLDGSSVDILVSY